MRTLRVAIVSSSIAAALAGTASAEIVTVACPGVGAGRNVSVTHNGTVRNVFAGQIMLNLTNSSSGALNGSWKSFCTELSQFIYVNGAPQVYQVLPLKDVPTPGSPMGEARANAIGRMYSFAAGAQYGSNADFAAAFQIAVWEIANDYNGSASSIDLAVGSLTATSLTAAISSNFASLFAAAGDTNGLVSTLVGLGNANFQDQIIDPTAPIPTPGALAVLGLAGAFGLRRRRS